MSWVCVCLALLSTEVATVSEVFTSARWVTGKTVCVVCVCVHVCVCACMRARARVCVVCMMMCDGYAYYIVNVFMDCVFVTNCDVFAIFC